MDNKTAITIFFSMILSCLALTLFFMWLTPKVVDFYIKHRDK